ncbi:MAG TPA: S49 family peptidase, partial [Candidatus Omnitrophota bacterium]|nr:S49 family peptidase [Candidatus Omnitrophota bacterium]
MRRLGRYLMGFLAVIGLLTISIIGLIIWGVASHEGRPALPSQMVLTLDLEAEFNEASASDPLAKLTGDKTYALREVVRAIDAAAADQRVAGLFATMGQSKLGLAAAQEVRDAVARFKASGKPAVVFAETMGEFGNGTLEYYLASGFGQVWLQPSGDVGLTGFMAESPFFKGTFDMLGIQAQFGARHEYKSAIETFTEKSFSPQHKESLTTLLDSWMAQTVSGIAAARNMPAEKVRALVGNPLLANEALSAGLVDKLGYRDEALTAAQGGNGRKEVDVRDYAAHAPAAKGTTVAVITGAGAIKRGEAEDRFGDQEFASATIAKAFRDAVDNPQVKAILFRVDSPGGSYVASDTVWHEVRR